MDWYSEVPEVTSSRIWRMPAAVHGVARRPGGGLERLNQGHPRRKGGRERPRESGDHRVVNNTADDGQLQRQRVNAITKFLRAQHGLGI